MSWLFCVISNKPFLKWEIEKFIQTHKTPVVNKIQPSFYLAAGGNQDNILLNFDNFEQDSGYLVLGNGYLTKDTGYGIAEKNDWKRLIDGDINWEDMNGQFVVFKWSTQQFEAWNDAFGMKDLYFTRSQGYMIISSRLDWLAEFLVKKAWNYNAFGAFTLLPNMLKPQALLNNVSRLGIAGYVKGNQFKFHNGNRRQNLKDLNPNLQNQFFFNLNKALSLQIDNDNKIIAPAENLFANRYLLSILLNKNKKNWALLEPDPTKSDEFEHFLQFQNALFIPSEKNPGIDDKKRLFQLWKDYLLTTQSANLPSELNMVQLFPMLNKSDYTLLLNNFNDFFMSKFDYRLSRYLIKGLEEMNPEALYKYLETDHSWLREEFYVFLKKGVIQHLTDFLNFMAESDIHTLSKKIQFFHIFIGGIRPQAELIAWLNQYGKCYSPFLINSLIIERLSINLSNAEMYKIHLAQIENNYPELLFHLKFKDEKIKLNDSQIMDNYLFELFADEIVETLSSQDIKKSPYYNHKKLDKIINKVNSGNQKIKRTLVKCFAFELWRQQFEK